MSANRHAGRRLPPRLIVLALAVLTFAACSGDDDDNGGSGTDEEASGECLPVDESTLDAIASTQTEGVGMTPVAGAAWRAPDAEDVTFIAMRFSGTGIDDQVGVWAVDNLDAGAGSGRAFAVDRTAQELTILPGGDTRDAAIAVDDPGVEGAKNCLE
jgi:hypothetical protein